MITDSFRTDLHKLTFTSYADMHSLPWLGDTPAQSEHGSEELGHADRGHEWAIDTGLAEEGCIS